MTNGLKTLDDLNAIESCASTIAGVIYGGVEPGSPQWRRCLDAAHEISNSIPGGSHIRFTKAAQVMKECKKFNSTYALGTDGFLTDANGQRTLVRLDGAATMFPDPQNSEIAMAWFFPVGWRACSGFVPKPKASATVAQELTAAGEKARQDYRLDIAEHVFWAAIHADPTYFHAMNGLGVVCHSLHRYQEAVAHYTAALAHNPETGEIFNNRSLSNRALGNYEAALADAEESIRLMPGTEVLIVNKASILDDMGRPNEAIALLDRYCERHPEKLNAAHNRSLILLSNSRFAEGWPAYRSRLLQPATNTHYEHYDVPVYQPGQSLGEGVNVLVWTEQGLGDELLTASMVPDLIATGANVTLLCSDRMHGLLMRSLPKADIEERPSLNHVDMFRRERLRPEMLPVCLRDTKFDVQMSQSDLGQAFRPNLEAFKGEPFLKSGVFKPTFEMTLRQKYPGNKLVGISWNSARNVRIGKLKGLDLKRWEPILKTPGVTFVCLQYGDVKDELEAIEKEFGVKVETVSLADPMEVLDCYADLVSCMDLVITVANTAVHVAGGLGVPTWVMLAEGPGRLWYYGAESEKMPWYSSVRLFRQKRSSQWDEVVARVADEFTSWAAKP